MKIEIFYFKCAFYIWKTASIDNIFRKIGTLNFRGHSKVKLTACATMESEIKATNLWLPGFQNILNTTIASGHPYSAKWRDSLWDKYN